MNMVIIAKKDFRQAIRSQVLLGLTALFALFTTAGVLVISIIPELAGPEGGLGLSFVYGLVTPATILVPIIGLLVGYKAIAGERESGSLNCLLGLPHTRFDVVLGKVLGRTAVVAVSILIGFAVGSIAIAVISESFSPLLYIGFTAITVFFGMAFVSLGIGLSAAVSSTSRAAWGAFGIFALFQFFWNLIGMVIRYATTGSVLPRPPLSDEYLLFTILNPQNAYTAAMSSLLPPGKSLNAASMMARMAGGELPAYFNGWFAFGVLFFWTVVPLTLGYLRFRRVELV
ncbi:ABC transporter permease [Halogeometricum borinquense]|uniref:ABC transporter permease n=1 Tax=Halogeometricum borinquense TaxID=60847 RepID=A0A482SY10_9EURY|nr:ABC transporter permease subunit [Halogeometricum borinquense]RYJ08374.1 ABC transporter permease [Halogeometricum borinquense]